MIHSKFPLFSRAFRLTKASILAGAAHSHSSEIFLFYTTYNFFSSLMFVRRYIALDIPVYEPGFPTKQNLSAADVCSSSYWQTLTQQQTDLEICQHIDQLGAINISLSDLNHTNNVTLPTIVPANFNITVAISEVLPFCDNMRFVSHKDINR